MNKNDRLGIYPINNTTDPSCRMDFPNQTQHFLCYSNLDTHQDNRVWVCVWTWAWNITWLQLLYICITCSAYMISVCNNYVLIFTRRCQKLEILHYLKKCDIFVLTRNFHACFVDWITRVSTEIWGFYSIYFCKSDCSELKPSPFHIIAFFWIKPRWFDQVNLENTLTNISSNECTNNFKWN
jgi:hypothetical protein